MSSSVNEVGVPRGVLIALLVAAVVCGALVAGVGAGLLARGGISVPLSRAIAFPAIGLVMYPVLKVRAAMRQIPFSTPFWKWAVVWVALTFVSYLWLAPAIEKLLA